MRLPNKVTPYASSVLSRFPDILSVLQEKDLSPKELYELTTSGKKEMGDFLSTLDCLFALGKIELVEEGGLLHYVSQD